MDYILKSIENYINTPNTSYAIQIDGDWGSGKTYYVTNDIKRHVEEMQYNFIYISLNGITDINTVKKELFYELGSKTSNITSKSLGMAKFISDVVSVAAPTEKLGEYLESAKGMVEEIKPEKLDKVLICFDDLERLSTELSHEELFGYISNNFLEHTHIKVLIISNEKEIKYDSAKFKRIKEKVIGVNLKFSNMNLSVAIENIARDYLHNEKLATWFYKEKEEVLKVIQDIQISNLRTIRFVFSNLYITLNEIDDYLNNIQESPKKFSLIRNLFLNILVIGNEVREGNILTDFNIESMNNWTSPLLIEYSKNSPPKDYINPFISRYHNKNIYLDENIFYMQPIWNIINNGSLINQEYNDVFERYLNKKFPPRKEITYKDLYYQIIDYLEMEYDELQEVIRNLLNELKKIKLSAKDYIEFMFRLLELEKQGLIDSDIQWKEVIQVEFEDSLIEIKGIKNIDDSLLMIPETEYSDLNKMIIEFNNTLQFDSGNSGQEIVKEWLDLLFEKKEECSDEKREVRQLTNFFEICNSLDVINNYLLKSNYLLNTFIKYIKESYIGVVNKSDNYKHEVKDVEQLLNDLGSIQKYKDKIQEINVVKLKSVLEDTIRHLNK